MSSAAIKLGFSRREDYVFNQSGVPMRAKDCGALNPESQEN
jgi:hypothetical protein